MSIGWNVCNIVMPSFKSLLPIGIIILIHLTYTITDYVFHILLSF